MLKSLLGLHKHNRELRLYDSNITKILLELDNYNITKINKISGYVKNFIKKNSFKII